MSAGRHATRSRNPVRALSGTGDLVISILRPTLSSAFTGALLLGAALMIFGAYAIASLHVSTLTVLTGSMRGTYDPGALLFTQPKPVAAVVPGDVIVFTPPGGTAAYTHRVVTATTKNGQRIVTTKGDANPSPDDWKAVLDGDTVPHVVGHVPHLGGLLLSVHQKNLRLPLLALLGLVVAVSGTRLILGSPRRGQLAPTTPAKEIPCPSTPPPLRPASTTRVPSPRPPSESAPWPSPERASTPRSRPRHSTRLPRRSPAAP